MVVLSLTEPDVSDESGFALPDGFDSISDLLAYVFPVR